jgi:AcrR family transcriptional regulator
MSTRLAREKADKRVLRTHEALRSALMELMIEHGYERISVQDVLDRANVGRATFYLHYRSKEDLLKRALDVLRDLLVREWDLSRREKTEAPSLGFCLAFFRHIDSHRLLYRAVVGRESGMIVDRQMRRLLADLMRVEVLSIQHRDKPNNQTEIATQYFVGALMSLVTWWLDHNIRIDADALANSFQQMSRPALVALADLNRYGRVVR